MTLLSNNLRLTAAYVFEKRNCSPAPVMMISLIFFITEIPVSKYERFFPAVNDHVNLLMLPLPTHSGQDLQALRNFALAFSRK